jgi:hypothetical protein
MNAAWGSNLMPSSPPSPLFQPDPALSAPLLPDPTLSQAKEAHMAWQQERANQRAVADAKAMQIPTPKPDFTVTGAIHLENQRRQAELQFPLSPAGVSADRDGDGYISMNEALLAPAGWAPNPVATLGQRSSSGQTQSGVWPSQTGTKSNEGVSQIPDPVFIVKSNGWPAGMEHWGLQQRLGWIRSVVAPWMMFAWVRNRLAEAEGILYEQYGPALGKSF